MSVPFGATNMAVSKLKSSAKRMPTLKSSKGNSLTTYRVLDFCCNWVIASITSALNFLLPALRVPMITSESCPSTSR